MISSATAQGLAQDRYWNLLLHYKPAGRGVTSMVDDPRFFLSSSGKTDPQAELEATITAFFAAPRGEAEHPRCRFAARYAWLAERLRIDETRMPPVSCSEFTTTLSLMNPRSTVLIFPAAHINSPASMFGHTLLRIDSAYESKLVSHAISYAAVTEASKGLSYAFKGMFGGYPGYYSFLPYYEKVKEYGSIEHRDVWEYELNLTPEETRRIVLHTWELRDMFSWYYFFDENCSYYVLYLLEIARPTLRLTDLYDQSLWFWVIPGDTVRLVIDSGIVQKTVYRPSQSAKIRHLAGSMPPAQQAAARELGSGARRPDGPAAGMPENSHAQAVFDLAAEYAQYRFTRRETGKEQYLTTFLGLLRARAGLGTAPEGEYAIPTPPRPEQGHRSSRLGMGAGRIGDAEYLELRWRAAYHDLLDQDDGYVRGAQINFLDITTRLFPHDRTARLDSVRLIDIVSLSPRDIFFRPLSWKVNTGVERIFLADGRDHLLAGLNAGAGACTELFSSSLLYTMVEADANAGAALERGYSIGGGPAVGAVIELSSRWKAVVTGRMLFYPVGDRHRRYSASLRQSFFLHRDRALELKVSREESFGRPWTDVSGGINWYF